MPILTSYLLSFILEFVVVLQNNFAGEMLKGHTYLNKDIMSFQMSYTYRNYLLPVLQEANDAAVRNGRSFATHSLILAAIISITSLVIFRFCIKSQLLILKQQSMHLTYII